MNIFRLSCSVALITLYHHTFKHAYRIEHHVINTRICIQINPGLLARGTTFTIFYGNTRRTERSTLLKYIGPHIWSKRFMIVAVAVAAAVIIIIINNTQRLFRRLHPTKPHTHSFVCRICCVFLSDLFIVVFPTTFQHFDSFCFKSVVPLKF